MSNASASALKLTGVGKMYKMFGSKRDNFLDALGLTRLRPWRAVEYREFWALRGIDLEVRHGERVGIIGRNGAGKSTLLRLVTGNLAATEGSLVVDGTVQALLEAGGGLHPEFTGYENIRASLTYQGLRSDAIARAEEDIADFTELGEFLDQPFKTYSLGMQARLAFAIATTVIPDILIIDEILGAGDAYFFSKSMSRMRDLVESGASVLIVSHALDQIQRFCQETIWLERGRVVLRGPTPRVVREYELFIRALENRRLRAKSKRMLTDRVGRVEHDLYESRIYLRFTAPEGGELRVGALVFRRDGEVEDELRIGGAQDADSTASSYVAIDGGGWSSPMGSANDSHRMLGGDDQVGAAIANLWHVFAESVYAISVSYAVDSGSGLVEMIVGENIVASASLPATSGTWESVNLAVHGSALVDRSTVPEPEASADAERPAGEPVISRWPGEGKLRIVAVELRDEMGVERAVFDVGQTVNLRLVCNAEEAGSFKVVFACLLFRLDGVVVSRSVSAEVTLELEADDVFTGELELVRSDLGNGYYSVSVGLYRTIDINDVDPSTFYDYVDRSYEFQVVGAPRMHNELLIADRHWVVEPRGGDVRTVDSLWAPDTHTPPLTEIRRSASGGAS